MVLRGSRVRMGSKDLPASKVPRVPRERREVQVRRVLMDSRVLWDL